MVIFIRPFWVEHRGCPIYSVDASPTMEEIVTCGGDGCFNLYNTKAFSDSSLQPKLKSKTKVSDMSLNVIRYSHDGRYVATGGDDHIVSIWELTERLGGFEKDETENYYDVIFTRVCNLRTHTDSVIDLCWLPGDKFLISVSADCTAAIWDVTKQELLDTYRDHKASIIGVCVDPLGVYACTQDLKEVRVWKIRDKSTVVKIEEPFEDCEHGNFSCRMSWSCDGKDLAVVGATSKLKRCFLLIKRSDWTYQTCYGHKNEVISARFSDRIFGYLRSAGKSKTPFKIFASGSIDGDVCIWSTKPSGGKKGDTPSFTSICTIEKVFDESVQDLVWCNSGKDLIAVGLKGFLAVIKFSYEEIGGTLVSEEALRKYMAHFKQKDAEEIQESLTVKEECRIQHEKDEQQQLKQKELEEAKEREEQEKANAKRPAVDVLHPEERKMLEKMKADKMKEKKKKIKPVVLLNEPKAITLPKVEKDPIVVKQPPPLVPSKPEKVSKLEKSEIEKNEKLEDEEKTLRMRMASKAVKETIEKEKERKEMNGKKYQERLDIIEEMRMKKVMKRIDQIDELENQMKCITERIARVENEKVADRLKVLEMTQTTAANTLNTTNDDTKVLTVPLIRPLTINCLNEEKKPIVYKSTTSVYGKKMFSYVQLVNVLNDAILWESQLPFQVTTMSLSTDEITIGTIGGVVLGIDQYSGAIIRAPLMVHGVIHNAFKDKGVVFVVKCDGMIEVYNATSELIKIVSVKELAEQLNMKNVTDVKCTSSGGISVVFDEDIEVVILNGHWVVRRSLVKDEEKRKNVNVANKWKMECELELTTLSLTWDTEQFETVIQRYLEVLKTPKDEKRGNALIRILNGLKNGKNDTLIEKWKETVKRWIVS
ncbi:protein HIRA, putative [Entamoeba invadens IP1]|uniref:Protein HIRA n=1 Tax=Entamoeba invadens IP1 TaxID=370355 RepID=A0A0A1TZ69_ENTIV|nr:protein HIRA, putative [Entamoeba invadens IP1]ELP86880.1 protein HIRA, putative [Entamoeba invadens IP1]|eukprot:XP_004253651.1 protein HIRA, putative [Entamoeba invadens IP1]